jgi:aerotaxis receptor
MLSPSLIGAAHRILRHPDMPAAAFKGLWDTLAEGEKWHGYVKNLRKDGAYYWVYAIVVANRRHGEVVGYTSVRRKPSRARIAAAEALYRTL